ncbi:MAG: CBS domain-containing protein [Cyclobacteriaceae bacterium]
MKISASLYANNSRTQPQLIQELDRCRVDYFHIDSVENLAVFEDIKAIQKLSNTPIDLHLISTDPKKYFQKIEKLGVSQVAIQHENIEHHPVIFPHTKTEWGLAISTETSIDVFEEYSATCGFILMMTSTPGQSGGDFRKENFRRIRQFRNRFPTKKIFVDGGINDEVAFILRMLGVTGIISGSYLVNHHAIGEAILHLKSSVINSQYQIKDFMISIDEAPHVCEKELSIAKIIQSIDEGDLGFTLIKGNNGTLIGLVSNADLRAGLMMNLDNLNNVRVDQIINTNPISIHEDDTISVLLSKIQQADFLVSFLPIIGENNELKGMLSFAHLIRSES